MNKHSILIRVAVAVVLIGIFATGAYFVTKRSSGPKGTPAATAQMPYATGPFRFSIVVEPGSPVVGDNNLIITIHTVDGQPVSGATVTSVAEMPAMGAMPAMRAPADMEEIAPGRYEGEFQLSMEGAWPLTIEMRKEGLGSARVAFDMATGRPNLRLSSGATPTSQMSSRDSGGGTTSSNDLPFSAGPYRFSIGVDPAEPTVGDNTLTVMLRTQTGEPVTGATIEPVAEMPAMGAMPAMRAPADMEEVAPGRYEGQFQLSMEGAWPLRIRISKDGMDSVEAGFDMATGRSGLRLSHGAQDTRQSQSGATDMNRDNPPGTITVDSRRRQTIGVKTTVAEEMPLARTIRAIGKVTYDETQVSDVSLKYEGWIGDLRADYVGMRVNKGDLLFTVFSPKLYSAQQEYLEAHKRAARGASERLLAAARERLRLWGVSQAQIKKLEQSGQALEYVPIYAPRAGTIVAKNIVDGTSQMAGATLLRIADLSEVWVEADVYEADLPLIQSGMEADVTTPYQPGIRLTGTVDYIYPYLNPATRTGRVRMSFTNPDGALKPDMYAEASLRAVLGTQLAVPDSAVIVAGENRVVFEDLGDGRLAPRLIQTGRRTNGFVEVLSGLEPGARIVSSGTFLIASESKLKAGIDQW
jgi:membrane fusion protein, copper/silver efflux system